jgi:glycosyltransferase involved in cell wall biosynthesis
MLLGKLTDWFRARWHGLGWAVRGRMATLHRWIDPHWVKVQHWLAMRRNRRREFRYELCACTMFKNEARYFDEWITFHRAVGVEHFYLYNNGSTDNFREVLEPWVQRGIVTLFDWMDEGGQVAAFNDCVRRFRMQARWIAFLDVDEFLFSPETRDLRTVLPRYEGHPAIFVYWILFGSNGHGQRPEGSVIENFTRCLDLEAAKSDDFQHGDALRQRDLYVTGWAKDGKAIANPRLVRKYYVHQPEHVWKGVVIDEKFRPHLRRMPGTVDLSCSVFRINHYWSKSIEDIRSKVLKGNACWDNKPNAKLDRWLERERHLNRTHDDLLVRFWREVKAAGAGDLPQ